MVEVNFGLFKAGKTSSSGAPVKIIQKTGEKRQEKMQTGEVSREGLTTNHNSNS